jgi:hypothetical protein
MSQPSQGLQARTETFHLHVEIQRDGGTLEEFESDFRQFSWTVPKFVYFAEPMSGLGAHLTLNAFETAVRDRHGDLMHVLVGGIGDLHQSGAIDLGAHAQIDYRVLRLSSASVYLGVDGTATIDPSTGTGSVAFGPAFSIQFGATAHPPAHH